MVKSVTYVNTRPGSPEIRRTMSEVEAAVHLVWWELALGGRIVDHTPEYVKVRTHIPGHVDFVQLFSYEPMPLVQRLVAEFREGLPFDWKSRALQILGAEGARVDVRSLTKDTQELVAVLELVHETGKPFEEVMAATTPANPYEQLMALGVRESA